MKDTQPYVLFDNLFVFMFCVLKNNVFALFKSTFEFIARKNKILKITLFRF